TGDDHRVVSKRYIGVLSLSTVIAPVFSTSSICTKIPLFSTTKFVAAALLVIFPFTVKLWLAAMVRLPFVVTSSSQAVKSALKTKTQSIMAFLSESGSPLLQTAPFQVVESGQSEGVSCNS